MSMTKKEFAQLRTIINRLHHGPHWYKDESLQQDSLLSHVHSELRAQTRMWVNDALIKDLQAMLPPEERVILPRT